MKKIGTIFFAIAVIAFIAWAMLYQAGTLGGGPKTPPGQQKRPPAQDLPWQPVTNKDITVVYNAVGTVRSREEIDVFSQLPSARVTVVHVNNGDAFSAGQLLIELDDQELTARVNAAKENLNRAESRRQFAENEVKRNEKLVATGTVARNRFDEMTSNLNATSAEVAMMTQELTVAQANLGYTRIHAPFAGIVAERSCDPGDLATPQNILLKIFNPTKLQIRVPIREGLFKQLHIGDMLQAVIDSTGKSYQAEIREIIPAVDPGSRTFIIIACLAADSTGLMPGMFATCDIPTGSRQAPAVPSEAIHRVGQLEYLTLRSQHGQPINALVRSIPIPNRNLREITAGAQPGDQFLLPPP